MRAGERGGFLAQGVHRETQGDSGDDLHHAEYQPGQTDASVIFQSVVAAGGGRPAAGAVR